MTRLLGVHRVPRGAPLRLWLRCTLLLWSVRLAVAWAASRPLAVVVGAGDLEDRLLFEPGGLLLLEVLRLRADLLLDALGATSLLLLGSWAVLLVATTAVLAQLGRAWVLQEPSTRPPGTAPGASPPGGDRAELLRSGRHPLGGALWARLPRVGVLSLVAGGAGVLVLLIVALVTGAVRRGLGDTSAATQELALVGLLLATLGAFGVIGALFDLARAHVVIEDLGVLGAVRGAWETFTRHLTRLVAVRVGVAVTSLGLVAGVAALVAAQSLEAPEGGSVTLVVLLHRVAGFLLAGLQVLWFGVLVRSMRSPGRAAPSVGIPAPRPPFDGAADRPFEEAADGPSDGADAGLTPRRP